MNLLNNIKEILKSDFSLVIDGPEHITYNEHQSFNPASTIKLFVLYAALMAVDKKEISLEDVISIPQNEIVPGAGVIQHLRNKKYTIHDLLTLMIAYSDNTATNIMLDVLTIDFIQSIVGMLNLKETFIKRKLYHIKPGVYNESSSHDLNIILHHLYNGENISDSSRRCALEIMEKQQIQRLTKHLYLCSKCHNLIINNVCHCGLSTSDEDPIKVLSYSKSGEIVGHVHDTAIIIINDQPVYVTIMTENRINNEETKKQLALIGQIIYRHYKEKLC